MSKTEKRIFMVAAILLIIVVALFVIAGRADKGGGIYRMSVIYAVGDNSKNLRKGLDSAALDMQIDLKIIQLDSNIAVSAFIDYIEQELAGKADAVIVLPMDSGVLDAYLNAYSGTTPLVVLGGRKYADMGKALVGPNDYDMGYSLGLYISGTASSVDLYVGGNLTDTEKQRTAGLIDAFGQMRVMVSRYTTDKEVIDKSKAAVTSCDEMLKTLAERGGYSQLFGFDHSAQTLYALEEGRITALAVYSDFDLGYRGIETAYSRAKGGRYKGVTLKHYIVTGKNMFESPYEQVILPIG